MSSSEEDFIKSINESSDFRKVAEYIINKFSVDLDIITAKDMAKYLINNEGYSVTSILEGLADRKIKRMLIERNSTKDEDYNPLEPKVPLVTKKKPISKKIVTLSLTTALLTFYVGNSIVSSIDKHVDYKVSNYIGMLASEPGSEDYEHKRSVVTQNKYVVSRNYQTGEAVIAYDFDKMSLDIIEICKKDADLLDVVLNNIYFDLENRLENADKLLFYLKMYTKDDESLQLIYNKIKDYNVFLEYLLARNLVDTNNQNYNLLVQDIESYKSFKDRNVIAYYKLSKDSQSRIDDLISKYREQKDSLNKLYKNRLEELVNEQGEIYGRNRN